MLDSTAATSLGDFMLSNYGILALTSILLWLWLYVKDLAIRLVLVQIELQSDDEAFDWVLQWLGQCPTVWLSQKSAITTEGHSSSYLKNTGQEGRRTSVKRLPGEGVHVFTFNGQLCWARLTAGSRPLSRGYDG